jgi:hypothetical protein
LFTWLVFVRVLRFHVLTRAVIAQAQTEVGVGEGERVSERQKRRVRGGKRLGTYMQATAQVQGAPRVKIVQRRSGGNHAVLDEGTMLVAVPCGRAHIPVTSNDPPTPLAREHSSSSPSVSSPTRSLR